MTDDDGSLANAVPPEPDVDIAVGQRERHIPRSLALALAFTAVTRLVVFVRFMSDVQLSGDERFYWRTSKNIIDLVGFGETSPTEALDEIIGRGWFMPGMSALLVPVRLFSDDIAVGRLWIGLLNFVLLVAIVHLLATRFGTRSAWAFWVIGTFMPTLVLFSFSLWGDVAGSSIVVLLTFATVAEAQRAFSWRSAWRWVLIGVGLGVLTYIRPSMLIISVVLVIGILLVQVGSGGWRQVLGATWRPTVIIALTSLVMIAPWSALLSADKEGPYLTTTSIELGQIVGFGDPEDLAEVVQDQNQWTAWDDFVQETARREEISYAEAMSQERSRILSTVSMGEYLERVRHNFDSLLLHPTGFINRLYRNYEGPIIDPIGGRGLVGTVQVLFWTGLVIVMFADLLIPRRTRTKQVWENIVLKLTMLALLAQPFVHAAHPRHHMALLVVLGVVMSIRLFGDHSQWSLTRLSPEPASEKHSGEPAEIQGLYIVQVVIAVSVAAVAVVLLVV